MAEIHAARILFVRVFQGDPDGQVGEAVTIEVPRGHGEPELVVDLGRALDIRAVLGPDLVPVRSEAVGRSVDQIEAPRGRPAPDGLTRYSEHEVRAAIPVEVGDRRKSSLLVTG